MKRKVVFYTIILHYKTRPRQRLIHHFDDADKENIREKITKDATKKSDGDLYAVDLWPTPPWDVELEDYKTKIDW